MDINNHTSSIINSTSAQLSQPSQVAGGAAVVPIKKDEQTALPLPVKEATVAQLTDQANITNSLLEKSGQGLTFSVDETTNTSVVKLVDKESNEVIKQFPNEGSLKMMQNIQAYLESSQERGGFYAKEGLTGSLINEIM